MDLIFTSADFKIGNSSYIDLPLLLTNDARIVKPVLFYFVHVLMNTNANDKKTFKAYGQHLYDYFGYLEAKGYKWNKKENCVLGTTHPINEYKQWCLHECGNNERYVNAKLKTLVRFYSWAYTHGLINELPFKFKTLIVRPGNEKFLTGMYDGSNLVQTTDILLKTYEPEISYLTIKQIQVLLSTLGNPAHNLMTRLALASGLRAEEITSFPSCYISEPYKVNDAVIRIKLDPKQMDLKYNKARSIDIPSSLLDKLWRYKITQRTLLEKKSGKTFSKLFLTKHGIPFTADGFWQILARISKKTGFYVHPHMLRHTYATQTLNSMLRERANGHYLGDPYLYIQRRLGHSNLNQTLRYAKFIDESLHNYSFSYQKELES